MKKRLVIAVCLTLLVAGAASFGRHLFRAQSAAPPGNNVPPQVAYRQLFHQVALFKRKADERRAQGQDDSFLRTFHKRQAKLSDEQAEALDKIASDCEDEVAQMDAQARRIVASFREQHAKDKLKPGEAPPPPPAELKGMQQQRDQIVLKAREQLRAAFGEAEFQRLDQYVQQEIAGRIRPMALDWPRPDINGSPRRPGQQRPLK
jgi:hypothetical protein